MARKLKCRPYVAEAFVSNSSKRREKKMFNQSVNVALAPWGRRKGAECVALPESGHRPWLPGCWAGEALVPAGPRLGGGRDRGILAPEGFSLPGKEGVGPARPGLGAGAAGPGLRACLQLLSRGQSTVGGRRLHRRGKGTCGVTRRQCGSRKGVRPERPVEGNQGAAGWPSRAWGLGARGHITVEEMLLPRAGGLQGLRSRGGPEAWCLPGPAPLPLP